MAYLSTIGSVPEGRGWQVGDPFWESAPQNERPQDLQSKGLGPWVNTCFVTLGQSLGLAESQCWRGE